MTAFTSAGYVFRSVAIIVVYDADAVKHMPWAIPRLPPVAEHRPLYLMQPLRHRAASVESSSLEHESHGDEIIFVRGSYLCWCGIVIP